MEGWRLPGSGRHGIGFGSGGGLQPDDTWFGDSMKSSPLPPQFAAQKRVATTNGSTVPAKVPRRGADPSGRLILEEPPSGATRAGGIGSTLRGSVPSQPFPSFAATAEAATSSTEQVPCAALQAGRLSFDEVMPAPPGADESFASEVFRIMSIGVCDYRRIFDLQPSEWNDLNLIQSKYRHLMRLLHPDKRRKDEEARAGGKDRCDRAVSLVQEALSKAKKEAQPDPQQELKNGMRRMQEMQRQRAQEMRTRMAQPREVPAQEAEAGDVESLLSDISQVLTAGAPARAAATSASDPSDSTSELMNLLASMRKT